MHALSYITAGSGSDWTAWTATKCIFMNCKSLTPSVGFVFLNLDVLTSRHPPLPGTSVFQSPLESIRMETWLWSPAGLSHATVVQANHLIGLWISSGEGMCRRSHGGQKEPEPDLEAQVYILWSFSTTQLSNVKHSAGWVLWGEGCDGSGRSGGSR